MTTAKADFIQSSETSDALQEVERSLLNEIVTGEVDFGEVRGLGLKAEDFYSQTHRLIYDGMKRLHERGEPINILTLVDELRSVPRPDDGEWASYLMYLDQTSLPTGGNIAYPIKKIKEASRCREIAEAGYGLYEAANKGDTESLQGLFQRVYELQSQDAETGGRLRPVSAKDLPDVEPLKTLWGGLLYPGCVTQLNAEPGAGKSTVAYNIAGLGAKGVDFVGATFPEPIKTLYVDLETPAQLRPLKIESICGERPESFYLLDDMNLGRDIGRLILLCKADKYDLVVLDTQSKVLGLRDENDNSEANRAAAMLTRLAKETGAAVLLIHHISKGGNSKEVYMGRGASALAGSVDIVSNLEVLDTDNLRLTLVKSRIPANFQPITMRKAGGDRFERVSVESKQDSEMKAIQQAIEELKVREGKVNQKALTEYLKGIIGRDRLHSLLKIGDGKLWQATRGERNEIEYESSFLKSCNISNQEIRNVGNDNVCEDGKHPDNFEDEAWDFLNKEAANL